VDNWGQLPPEKLKPDQPSEYMARFGEEEAYKKALPPELVSWDTSARGQVENVAGTTNAEKLYPVARQRARRTPLPYADDPRWVGTVAADGPHKVQDKIGARSVQKFSQTRAIPFNTVGPFRPEARPLPFVEPSRLWE
jgi:hypothetical protein